MNQLIGKKKKTDSGDVGNRIDLVYYVAIIHYATKAACAFSKL